jgi:hypothetical protein
MMKRQHLIVDNYYWKKTYVVLEVGHIVAILLVWKLKGFEFFFVGKMLVKNKTFEFWE